ncbi:hypothetical protein AAT19DRAFT_11575 [Rhodotorula toruloides]|uniref:Uncharacterized protein n=1 Tax=Rhodotorula toruloides TaxID=5286 RepID=A0A2S9ZVZ0_RHOTO|nr:hypothetical protein AAT19DRAFT_11575 [Rhodotorula toruloides]
MMLDWSRCASSPVTSSSSSSSFSSVGLDLQARVESQPNALCVQMLAEIRPEAYARVWTHFLVSFSFSGSSSAALFDPAAVSSSAGASALVVVVSFAEDSSAAAGWSTLSSAKTGTGSSTLVESDMVLVRVSGREGTREWGRDGGGLSESGDAGAGSMRVGGRRERARGRQMRKGDGEKAGSNSGRVAGPLQGL